MYGLRKFSSRSPHLLAAFRAIFHTCAAQHVRLTVRYVRSEDNPSDWWSRLRDKSDWKLNPRLFRAAARRWGSPTIDLFASPGNRQCTRFCTRFHSTVAKLGLGTS
ncbi:hypothetical protein NFJ02_17g27420 [Pycnococcus provasolii]